MKQFFFVDIFQTEALNLEASNERAEFILNELNKSENVDTKKYGLYMAFHIYDYTKIKRMDSKINAITAMTYYCIYNGKESKIDESSKSRIDGHHGSRKGMTPIDVYVQKKSTGKIVWVYVEIPSTLKHVLELFEYIIYVYRLRLNYKLNFNQMSPPKRHTFDFMKMFEERDKYHIFIYLLGQLLDSPDITVKEGTN